MKSRKRRLESRADTDGLRSGKRTRGLALLAAAALLGLLVDVALFAPELLLGAFNPVSTNVAALALCAIALLGERDATPPRPPPLR